MVRQRHQADCRGRVALCRAMESTPETPPVRINPAGFFTFPLRLFREITEPPYRVIRGTQKGVSAPPDDIPTPNTRSAQNEL